MWRIEVVIMSIEKAIKKIGEDRLKKLFKYERS